MDHCSLRESDILRESLNGRKSEDLKVAQSEWSLECRAASTQGKKTKFNQLNQQNNDIKLQSYLKYHWSYK